MENSENLSNSESRSSFFEWSKSTILRFKNSNIDEKGEMQRLNVELKKYLTNVRILEDLNNALLSEIEQERKRDVPIFTSSGELNEKLLEIRKELEKSALDLVEQNLSNDENKESISDLRHKTNFFEYESSLFKQKIPILEAQLNEFLRFKEVIFFDVNRLEKAIKTEQEKLNKTNSEIQNSRKVLNSSKLSNKKIEFEIDTLKDELAFRQEVHNQELDEMKKNIAKNTLSDVQIDELFRNELINSIKKIRQDFYTLNEQQLQDYKKYKQEEVDISVSLIDEENETRSRIDNSLDLSNRESETDLTLYNTELNLLKKNYFDKINKLSQLESNLKDLKEGTVRSVEEKQKEIDTLKQKNTNLKADLDYWEKYLRSKLENEIQTFRSILNCQYLIMNEDSNDKSSILIENFIAKKNSSSGVNPCDSETLQTIFNYFDYGRNGTINSSDFENIMQKLNVKISNEAYKQVCRDFDKEGKIFEF
jgi:lamin B